MKIQTDFCSMKVRMCSVQAEGKEVRIMVGVDSSKVMLTRTQDDTLIYFSTN